MRKSEALCAPGAAAVSKTSGHSAQDAVLLAEYVAGPGGRPTAAEGQRWIQAARDGRLPRRRLAAG